MHQAQPAKQECGTALAMALLFLAVLTVLGLAGMNAARQEILIAGNKRQQDTALGNTEYVLAAGEQDILSVTGNPFSPDTPGDPYYPIGMLDFDPVTTGVIDRPADRNWAFSHTTLQLPDLDNNRIADDGTGEYVIQDTGLLTVAGEDAAVNGTLRPLPGARLQAFRVTARSATVRGAARRVQTVVLREPLPQGSELP